MASPFLYPVALDVRGRRCIVVGGGAVGARKAEALQQAGADVVVVTPETTGPFAPAHLEDAFLVVAATDDPAVNAAVAQAARERRILLNLAAPGEETDAGDFATMAAVRRGDLLVGVTTGGASPSLAAHLRRELAAQFPPPWAEYVALLAEFRSAARSTEALRRLAESDSVRQKALAGEIDAAREEARACLY